MAQLNYNVDENDVFEGGTFEPLPAGKYRVVITESDVVTPKSGNGLMVKLTYEVLDQGYENRKLFDNIMIQHSSQQAETIGKQKLNTIGVICGLKRVQDTAQLHGKVMEIQVGIKQDANYGTQNTIKKYFIPEAVQQEAPTQKGAVKPKFVK